MKACHFSSVRGDFFINTFALEVSFIICLEWVWSTSAWVPWTRSDQIKTQQKRISYLLRCCISPFPLSRERALPIIWLLLPQMDTEQRSSYPKSPALHIQIKWNPAASVFLNNSIVKCCYCHGMGLNGTLNVFFYIYYYYESQNSAMFLCLHGIVKCCHFVWMFCSLLSQWRVHSVWVSDK